MLVNPERPCVETILVVDDDPMLRALIERFLCSRGFTVLTAVSGSHALQVAAAHSGPIHLVVSDVVMADMGGPELFRQLRAWLPGIRFLFVSGQIEGADADLSTDGRAAFLPKPFSMDALMTFVRQVLEADSHVALAMGPQ